MWVLDEVEGSYVVEYIEGGATDRQVNVEGSARDSEASSTLFPSASKTIDGTALASSEH